SRTRKAGSPVTLTIPTTFRTIFEHAQDLESKPVVTKFHDFFDPHRLSFHSHAQVKEPCGSNARVGLLIHAQETNEVLLRIGSAIIPDAQRSLVLWQF